MILGTSKNSLILGPIIGHFWARGPRICGLSYTKIPQKILESIWEHLGIYDLSMSGNHFFENVRKVNHQFFFNSLL